MAALDLVTAEQLPATVRDTVAVELLPLLITSVSETLAFAVGYPLHRRTAVEETAMGRGGVWLWLKSGAVQRVTRVEVRGQERAPATYQLDSSIQGRVKARGVPWPFTGTWSTGVSQTPMDAQDTGEIVVTFDSGWVTPGQRAEDPSLTVDLPASIQLAAIQTVGACAELLGSAGDIASESVGDASVSYVMGPNGQRMAVPATARQLLAPYRKVIRV